MFIKGKISSVTPMFNLNNSTGEAKLTGFNVDYVCDNGARVCIITNETNLKLRLMQDISIEIEQGSDKKFHIDTMSIDKFNHIGVTLKQYIPIKENYYNEESVSIEFIGHTDEVLKLFQVSADSKYDVKFYWS